MILLAATLAALAATIAFLVYYATVMDWRDPIAQNAWHVGFVLAVIESVGLVRRAGLHDTADVLAAVAYLGVVFVMVQRTWTIARLRRERRQ